MQIFWLQIHHWEENETSVVCDCHKTKNFYPPPSLFVGSRWECTSIIQFCSPSPTREFCQTCSPMCAWHIHNFLHYSPINSEMFISISFGLSCWLSVDNSSFVWARGLWIWIPGSLLAHLGNALWEISKEADFFIFLLFIEIGPQWLHIFIK